MTYDQYISYSSEIKELEALLVQIPQSDIINRMSLETRLKNAQTAVAGIDINALPKKARLTFRGKPVVGSYGVAAEFGAKASTFFADAYAAITAGLSDDLRYMGPIPDKQKNRLLITGVAVGSFGFEFELPNPSVPEHPHQEILFSSPSPAEDAMEKLEKLLQVSAQGSDDDITELVDDLHKRSVKKVADFLDYLSEQEAWCGLEFKDKQFKFAGIDQVRRAANRLRLNDLQEEDKEIAGSFIGVLPRERTFEFEVKNTGQVIKGKVASSIADPAEICRDYLYKSVIAKFHRIQMGQARPRHTLLQIKDIRLAQADNP